MNADEKTIALFTTRVRQLILEYNKIKNENDRLRAMIDERDSALEKMEGQLAQVRNDYESLKMARMVEITNGDLESAQKKISKLIRDVNKCITLVSER
ncbi:MAG: hypothetical protein BHV84_06045 [Prevotella sp. AG:487_50_53]|jgi:phage shock protein A|uniref:Uncharacterized protein n=1 Tax=Leyella lascolaii TaxID=1776379 RepID=A0AAW7JHM6_9BACT|nr:hypothetical protein [Leyella lascolaii]MDN0022957.1 hypothetical protein [Leyella lascolaii]MDN0025339.1 hypothetical protein [Leyella lascolaii]OKZ26899.1 MAG: hypothetical protein BHV84_06045 [Prevotella sp. AG:487_50_53]CCZ15599.1 putative uncharacterized protein [Prevotella sp. CAG:487]